MKNLQSHLEKCFEKYVMEAKYQQSIDILELMSGLNSDIPAFQFKYSCLFYLLQDKYVEAFVCADLWVKQTGPDLLTYFLKGVTLACCNCNIAAIEAFTKANNIKPMALTHYWLAKLYIYQGELSSVLHHVTHCFALDRRFYAGFL